MATSKNIPRRLVSDTDEKMLQPSDMVDALNVTVSDDGEGTSGVIKNVRGTAAVDFEYPDFDHEGLSYFGNKTRVLGSVADDSRGHIYFFVKKADDETEVNAAANEDTIFRYSKDDNNFVEVLKTDMGFGDETNITSTVVSGYFSQTTDLETIVYFTGDSLSHPPRKINADRAIAGDYDLRDDLSDAAKNILLSTCKPPITICPSATFETDSSLDVNNFTKKSFQFATQLVYKDGEVSAISPYSKITASIKLTTTGIDDEGLQPKPNRDNVCVITTNYASYTKSSRFVSDVKFIRIIGRNGNNSEMFIIDEVDPNKSLTRKIFGSDREVYNHHSGVYRFFNDSAYRAVDQDTVLKPFDNVPKYAMGQTISGNRLTYSYYKEGYDNGDVNGDPVKGNLEEVLNGIRCESNGVSSVSAADAITNASAGAGAFAGAEIDFAYGSSPMASWESRKGDRFRIACDINIPSSISLYDNVTFVQYGIVEGTDGNFYGGHVGATSSNPLVISGPQLESGENHCVKFETNYTWQNKKSNLHELYKTLIAHINNNRITANFTYDISDGNCPLVIDYVPGGATTFSSGDTVDFTGTVNVEYYILASYLGTEAAHTGIKLDLRVERLWNADMQPASDESSAASGEIFNATNRRRYFRFINDAPGASKLIGAYSEIDATQTPSTNNLRTAAGNITNKIIDVERNSAVTTFKTGSSHDIGIVYYDEFNRPGFVNKIGSFYAKGQYERTFNTDMMQASMCKVQMTSSPPSWAKSFQFVYPGMGSFSNLFTYSAGEARTAFDQGEWEKETGNSNHTTSNPGVLPPASPPFQNPLNPRDINDDEFTFWERDLQRSLVVDYNNRYIYLPLTTLTEYRDKKGAEIDYNFQKGDILRIVSSARRTSSPYGYGKILSYQRKQATSGGAIEFRVIDQVTLYDDENNPLYPTHTPENGNKLKMKEIYMGRFLVLEAVRVNKPYNDNGDLEKYPQYDWYSTSAGLWDFRPNDTPDPQKHYQNPLDHLLIGQNIMYDDGTPDPSGITGTYQRDWGRVLIEILTPKQETSNRVWYEIGECHDISKHSDPITISGDAYIRYSSVNMPSYDKHGANGSLAWNTGRAASAWGFHDCLLETAYLSDYFSDSNVWSKGKTHVEVQNDGERFYRSSIVHSDEYQSDINILTLASFNPAKANFFSFDKKYGSLYYIGDYNDRLIGLHQQKVSMTTVNKNILSYADGEGAVSVSENPFGSTVYASADFGLSDPYVGSVVNTGSAVYFIDYDREEVGMVQGNSVVSISDIGMRSAFEDRFGDYKSRASTVNIVSGYDPRDQVVFFTFNTGDSGSSRTYGYSEKTRGWASRYGFIPERYDTVDNRLFSFKNVISSFQNEIMHEHTDSVDRCRFYGTPNTSSITFVVNAAPGKVKVFDALSLETDSDGWSAPDGEVTTDIGSSGRIRSFEAKEGVRYAAFGRDEADNVATLIPLGRNVDVIPTVIDANTGSITFNNKLDRLPIKKGMGIANASLATITGLTIKSVNGKELTFNNYGGSSVAPTELYAIQDTNEVNGNPIRGAWAKVKIQNGSTSQYELYAINTHISDSPNHYG